MGPESTKERNTFTPTLEEIKLRTVMAMHTAYFPRPVTAYEVWEKGGPPASKLEALFLQLLEEQDERNAVIIVGIIEGIMAEANRDPKIPSFTGTERRTA